MKLDVKADGCRSPLVECFDKNRMETEKPVFDTELGSPGKDALRNASKIKSFVPLERGTISEEHVVGHKLFSGPAHDGMLANNAGFRTKNKLFNLQNKVSTKDFNVYTEQSVEEGSAKLIISDKNGNPCCLIRDVCLDEGRPSDEDHLGQNHNPPQNKDVGSSPDKGTTNDGHSVEVVAQDVSSGSLENALRGKGAFSPDEAVTNELSDVLLDDLPSSHVVKPDVLSGSMKNASCEKRACDEALLEKSVALISHSNNLTTSDVQESALEVTSQESTSDAHLPSPQLAGNSGNQELSLPFNSKIGNRTITFDFEPSIHRSTTDGDEDEDITKKSSHSQFRSLADLCLEEQSLTAERVQDSDRAPPSCELSDSQRRSTNLDQADVSGRLQPGSYPMSESLMFSGPVPYSGSISLRSESSTTSTHSFAFPILNPEWNSSPVRMAKADHKRFRKQKWWRNPNLCCRF